MQKRLLAAFLAALLLLALTGCSGKTPEAPGTTAAETTGTASAGASETAQPADTAVTEPAEIPAAVRTGLHPAESYDEVREALSAAFLEDGIKGLEVYEEEAPAAEAEVEAPMEYSSPNGVKSAAGGDDFSGTNVQVKGIDEADIVKTDGTYIYAVSGGVLRIFLADGADTELLSETETCGEDCWTYPGEMFLLGDKLYLLVSENKYDNDRSTNVTTVLIYDLTDRSAPVKTGSLGLEGSYRSSRMTDGTLYLITNRWSWYCGENPEPEEYIPRVYCENKDTLLSPGQIYLCDGDSFDSVTVVGAIDCASGSFGQTLAFSASAETVYMSANAIYLADSVWKTEESEPYEEDRYTVVAYRSTSKTGIIRISLENGVMTPAGSAEIDGSLLNQFALDEYEGNLRVAATANSSSYKIYTDEKYGFSNYKWDDGSDSRSNCVVVLDKGMNVLSSIDNLAEDESIYSVRFMGPVGYVVTYESIDPVFTVDLSDPANPVLKSALEVPGVSDYLHGYGDGLLFGFGRAVDENQVSGGLQLSMFDVSDSGDVKLLAQTTLEDTRYSEALYNHKAILVSAEKNLIAFPVDDSGFRVYSYLDGKFVEKGSFSLEAETEDGEYRYWSWSDTRGLYIGSVLYLVGSELLYAVDMDSFEILCTLNYCK